MTNQKTKGTEELAAPLMAGEQLSSDDEVPDKASQARGSVSERCVFQPGGPSAVWRDRSIQ